MDTTVFSKVITGLKYEDVKVEDRERTILKELAARVGSLARSKVMEDKRDLWRRHNRLEKTRPVIFCDPENGWNEIITERQMVCKSTLARRWEMDLRMEIFWGEEMGDDRPVEPFFDVPYTVSPDDWGVNAEYRQTESLGSYVWDAPIKDYDSDLAKLHYPELQIDWETTNGCYELAKELFDGILTVRLKGTWWWSLGLTWPAATLRGLENMFLDFIDHPDGIGELLDIISNGFLHKLDCLEKNNLLSLNNDGTYVGSGGLGFTSDLPGQDFDGNRVRARDLWGFSESQETVHVSPEMYEKFIFPREDPILKRFGLNCYGCCEPLHDRWPIVKNHHNLRRVSCSPWIDLERMAGYLEDKYIFSWKASPFDLANADLNENKVRADIKRGFEKTKGCIVEIMMKDNHTIGKNPANVVEWCRIAQEEAAHYEQ